MATAPKKDPSCLGIVAEYRRRRTLKKEKKARERYELRSGRGKGFGAETGAENRIKRWLETGVYRPHGYKNMKFRVDWYLNG